MKVKLRCPTCQNTFDNLPNLNKHIGATGCNNGISINPNQLMKSIGIKLKYSTSA